VQAIDWHPVARSGSAQDRHEWLVLYDSSACFGLPGQDDVVAVHLVRDHATRTYTADRATFSCVARAEGWLRARGAGDLTRECNKAGPDDDITRGIEDRVRQGFGHHDRVHSFVDHAAMTARTVYLDRAARDPAQAFVAHVNYMASADTYAIREQSFATADQAIRWADEYPLPQPRTELSSDRTAAALAQSTASPVTHTSDSPTRLVEIVPPHRSARKP